MKTRILMSVLAIGYQSPDRRVTMAWFTDDAEVPEATFTAGTVDIDIGLTEMNGVMAQNGTPGTPMI